MKQKRVTYSLPNLKSLVDSPNSCVYCFTNCSRSLTVLPMHLDNIKHSVNELLHAKVTMYDGRLKGIILGHKNIKVVNNVQLNDDGNFGLDYIADIYIFRPEAGKLLSGEVSKKSKDDIGVLVHAFFNVSIPRPRFNNECPRNWIGFEANIGQPVTFEVVKVNFAGRLPFIKGKLIDVGDNENEDGDSGIGGHDSMEENSITKESTPVEWSENTIKKKKKKKKNRSSEKFENGCEEESKMDDSMKRYEESQTEHLMDSLIKEAESQTYHSPENKKKKKKKSSVVPCLETEESFSLPTESTIETLKKHKKSKRKRKLSDSDLFSPSEPSNNFNDDEVTELQSPKKKKKKKSSVVPCLETEESFSLPTESTIETPKKHKKSKRKRKLSDSDLFSPSEPSNNFNDDEVTELQSPKKKKKKKSSVVPCLETEESFSLPTESTIETLKKHKKSKRKRKLSDSDLFSPSEPSNNFNDDEVTELQSPKKKKKKKHSVSNQMNDFQEE